MEYYESYRWETGRPIGVNKKTEPIDGICYRIISDPYFRRTSLEKYINNQFSKIIYDSALLNFRHLNPQNQVAWQKVVLEETANQQRCLIRDQDDRIILFETYHFNNNQCRWCQIDSVHGLPLAKQYILYKNLGDPINGVILFDNENNPIMCKEYKIDEKSGEFGEMIKENWMIKPEEAESMSIVNTSKLGC